MTFDMKFEEWWYKHNYDLRYGKNTKKITQAAWSAATTAERKQAEIDAIRYRRLRNANMNIRNRLEHYSGLALDIAIDNMEES